MSERDVSVEAQVADLASRGLPMAPGASIDDLITLAGGRERLEAEPYLLLLSVAGASQLQQEDARAVLPTGQVDLECVEDDDSYPRVVRYIASAAGTSDRLDVVTSSLGADAGTCTISVRFDGTSRLFEADVRGDWADSMTLCEIAELLSPSGYEPAFFYPAGALGIAWVPDGQAEALESFLRRYAD
ncbi:hypothetical protein [Nocardioides sp. LHG3406-4]|uniref:hypothetical protein n=1 Tax=Nocardioides sp. LHG3406-4 TaxID=2804575 RepID=UPI003CE80129